jgi:hypothetical protein
MSARERKPRRPVRRELRHAVDIRNILGLGAVTKITSRKSSFEVTVAHDGSGLPGGISLRSDRTLDIRQIGAKNEKIRKDEKK